MKSLLATAILLLAAPSAFAGLSEEIVACSNVGNTIEINQCTATLAAREDERMKDEFSRSVAVLERVEKSFAKEVPKPQLVTPLRRAQAAWEKYKSAECQLAVAQAMGGSVSGLDYQACVASMNEERGNKLQALRVQYERQGY